MQGRTFRLRVLTRQSVQKASKKVIAARRPRIHERRGGDSNPQSGAVITRAEALRAAAEVDHRSSGLHSPFPGHPSTPATVAVRLGFGL
jgi:hypothetical protein